MTASPTSLLWPFLNLTALQIKREEGVTKVAAPLCNMTASRGVEGVTKVAASLF
jgi:hypothetical protein